MSANAASLPCPICSHIGVFDSAQSLRDKLIAVSTNKISCPVCQEEVSGLDKLTIHLFSHVKLVKNESEVKVDAIVTKNKSKNDVQAAKVQQKKPKGTSSKNKPIVASNMPVKFVKIYPKLPVISLNPVPIIDITCSQRLEESAVQTGTPICISSSKPEASISQTNTICNVCGLQFVDVNVLKMHRSLIHNIDENSNLNTTRYDCHLCPKNFKMRGSLMVHLRVAHFGFSSAENGSASNIDKNLEEKTVSQIVTDQQATIERNDNKQWQCDVCRKCFTTKYFLKKHKRLHTGETPYACTQCNKTFTFQQSYHKHLLYHNDEKPHTCSHCGRAFKELSTLHNHQRIHTGEKPFSCETCGKCFRQRVSYLVHRRIHTGAMPYKCTACDKSFRYKVSQRTHKCQAQPPGTVVRQTGELIEKLKKKYGDSEAITEDLTSVVIFPELSEANAELVRRGAELSLEDMESENFTFIPEVFEDDGKNQLTSHECTEISNDTSFGANSNMYTPNIEELIDSLPSVDKNIPSPSEILKNLCLSNNDDRLGNDHDNIVTQTDKSEKHFEIFL